MRGVTGPATALRGGGRHVPSAVLDVLTRIGIRLFMGWEPFLLELLIVYGVKNGKTAVNAVLELRKNSYIGISGGKYEK